MARKKDEARTGQTVRDLGIAFAGSVGISNIAHDAADAKPQAARVRHLRVRFGLTPPSAALVAALAYGEGR